MNYFDKSKISLRRINKNIAKQFVEKWHYSHKWTLCNVAYGIFYLGGNDDQFFNYKEEKLIGVVVYGGPVGRAAAESISSIIKINEVIELVRLVIMDGYGGNIESYCISKTLKMIKQDFPNLKAVISYADSEQGHKGTIYQACNFYYQGNSDLALMPSYSISLVGPPYKWIHSRSVSSTYGSHNVEFLKKRIGHTFWRKKESTKHRYIYLLVNKVEKKRILDNLKHPFKSYPKDTTFIEEIQEISVETPLENQFFGV